GLLISSLLEAKEDLKLRQRFTFKQDSDPKLTSRDILHLILQRGISKNVSL
ncbi:hypothetical protein ATANTOWER_002393, partial [Ataeniobius toweri]|nr:hypothetical protein [Ataeniobius toweri]